MIALVALAQSELEWLKYYSHRLLLIFKELSGLESLSRRSRKLFSLRLDT